MQTIEVIIPPSGEDVRIETKGFSGKACKDATKGLEGALGVAVADTLTPEYNQAPAPAQDKARAGR